VPYSNTSKAPSLEKETDYSLLLPGGSLHVSRPGALPVSSVAEGMLSIKRGYWVVESRLHHCLDITLREDQSRVRTPGAARVLGTIRRVVVSLANAAVDRARKKNPKTKCNTRSFQKRFRSARGGRERLHALIFAKSPNVLDL